ncbi:hypothetical protein ACSCBZ_24640 [Streptomyces niveiscabiei]|uniref:hypothetical protein n=1 Tax=Streptomyces niveiscabiei TaxID=164115 RepID=UPI0006EB654F|nr:hypothetical protein [Streptomyces niveiscabiei]
MSDSILVRVTLDAYDAASTGRQTQVYVQIPRVARASWLLPEDAFHRLKDRAWPEVLDSVEGHIAYGDVASNAPSTAAWAAIQKWMRDPANRDEMQAAYEEDCARRDPATRKLLAEITELKEQRERRRLRLIALDNDALEIRGLLSPNGAPRRVPMPLGKKLAPVVEWLLNRVAELETLAGTAIEYRLMPVPPEYTPLIVRRDPAYDGTRWAVLHDPGDLGVRRVRTRSGWRMAALLHDAEVYCWPDGQTAWAEALRIADGADGITRVIAPTQTLQPEPDVLRHLGAEGITNLAPARSAGVQYDSTSHTIDLSLTATREQWRVWQRALDVDLARTTHRGGFVTSHAQWRGTHVVIRCFFVEPDAAPPTVTIYRAQWDSIPLGLYLTDEAARAHCEAHARRDLPTAAVIDWVTDEDDGVADLVATVDGGQSTTGYEVVSLEVASEYDEEADE